MAKSKELAKKSPVRHVDPVVRALNTVMYGLIAHFGTMWMVVGSREERCDVATFQGGYYWWAKALLAHEYWVYLQHANVFGNPLCQRLDRQYGIALLRANQHWAIAGTLSAYWCRESLCMFLCLPLVSRYTQYLVLYSLIYHTIKSRGVRQDALRRHSPTFGIMRIVIDKFYLHTTSEQILTLVRLFLQGFDTWIHAMIVSDLLVSPLIASDVGVSMIHWLFGIWVAHAAMNQYFTTSTATIMVRAWNSLSSRGGTINANTPNINIVSDTESEGLSDSDESDEDNDGFEVRHLLRPGRVPDVLKGTQGSASGGVDTAVRIELTIAIIAATFIVGLGDVPLRILVAGGGFHSVRHIVDQAGTLSLWATLPYAWVLWSILYASSVFLLRQRQRPSRQRNFPRKRFIVYALDVAMMILGVSLAESAPRTKLLALLLGIFVTVKSFQKAARWQGPKIYWKAANTLEIIAKTVLGRYLGQEGCEGCVALVGAVVCFVWSLTTVATFGGSLAANSTSDPTSPSKVADIVFLGHPAELSDCWALWLMPYSLNDRWKRPWWTVPLWPLHYLVGLYTCHWRRKLFGDVGSFANCDDVTYQGIRMQSWTALHFGRHFVTSPLAVKRNIEAAARYANDTGVKVLCLGALNKAESINGGGVGLVQALGPRRKVSIMHGNHLTAAAVVETTHQCFGNGAKVFLTGASSKVGWAVARALRDRYGYNILCHSTDQKRRDLFKESGFEAASALHEGTSFSNLWIVGKYDPQVAVYIPQGATAVVFSVPHPLQSRKDVRVIEAGTLHMDLSRLNRPRLFTNKLKAHEIFACHAAGVVAMNRLTKVKSLGDSKECLIDETGPVNPDVMDSWLDDAKALGFVVPTVSPVSSGITVPPDLSRFAFTGQNQPAVVVVGAGPAGLAVAASLRQDGLMCTVLDEQTDVGAFGSWDKHFSGLSITTQKRWCTLPGYHMDDKEFPGETVDATEYRRYLRMYAERFGIAIKRGYRVDRIVRGEGGESPSWIVECNRGDCSFSASAVVVATGKHRNPQRDTGDNVGEKMSEAGINVVHSTDLKDEKTWERAIAAARHGKLCIVGLGNSAADICTAILQSAGSNSSDSTSSMIHIAARTIPPIFPRRQGFLRVDTIGSFMRWMPTAIEEVIARLLWCGMPDSAACDAAFPAHLPRWKKLNGRVPVIDKFGQVADSLRSGAMVGHGPVFKVMDKELVFEDGAGVGGARVSIDMAIMATGYKKECIIAREDRLNGLFLVGFGNDRLLPLKTIGEEAGRVAKEIAENQIVEQGLYS